MLRSRAFRASPLLKIINIVLGLTAYLYWSMMDNEFAGEEEVVTQRLRDMLEAVGRHPRLNAIRNT